MTVWLLDENIWCYFLVILALLNIALPDLSGAPGPVPVPLCRHRDPNQGPACGGAIRGPDNGEGGQGGGGDDGRGPGGHWGGSWTDNVVGNNLGKF